MTCNQFRDLVDLIAKRAIDSGTLLLSQNASVTELATIVKHRDSCRECMAWCDGGNDELAEAVASGEASQEMIDEVMPHMKADAAIVGAAVAVARANDPELR